MKKIKKRSKFLSLIPITITLVVLFMLIISGPAKAFEFKLDVDDGNIQRGDEIVFTSEINIKNIDSNLPIEYILLEIDGKVHKECKFDLDGNKLTSCPGVKSIKVIEDSTNYGYGYRDGYFNGNNYNFGYGYGLNDGKMVYEITYDTSVLVAGDYETRLIVKIQNTTFSILGDKIKISESDSISDGTISDEAINLSDVDNFESSKILKFEEGTSHYFRQGSKRYEIKAIKIDLNNKVTELYLNGYGNMNFNLGDIKPINLDSDEESEFDLKFIYVGEKASSFFVEIYDRDVVFEKDGSNEMTILTPPSQIIKRVSRNSYGLESVSYQLTHFSFIWILILLNLIGLEMIGIVSIRQ